MTILEEIHSTLIEAERQGDLTGALLSAEMRSQRHELGDVLCELHNAGEIDLTSSKNLEAIDALERNDFWIAIHPLNAAIAALDCSHREVLGLVSTLVKKAGDDGLAGMPNMSLVTWARKYRSEASKIIEGIRQLDELCLAHGLFAVLGIGDEAAIFDLMQSSNGIVRALGLRALGRLEVIEIASVKKGIDAACEVILRETDQQLRTSAIEAAFRLWEKLGPSEPYRQTELINHIGKHTHAQELSSLSAALFFHNKGLPKESIDLVLSWLATTPSNSEMTLRNLDDAIESDEDRWEFERVVPVFAQCIPRLEAKAKQRDYHNFYSWVWSDPRNASFLFSQWLNTGKFALCSFLTELLSASDKNALVSLQKAHLPAKEDEQMFIARKCIGFLWHQEVSAASIMLSIVKNGKVNARALAEELLFNPLLLSYDGDLRDYLETQRDSTSKRIADCTARILAKHDDHVAGIETTKDLVELLPTIEQRRTAAMKDRERNRDIEKQAHERSIFASLMTRQTLLYGKKSFSIIHGGDGEKHPSVMELSEFSYSTELPRLSVVDPVGFSAMITIFRAMERRHE
ncbi:MAG: hypothetical protein NXI17_06480 [Alphaproteobacteria bacterium]|nr:hypothetical protein [Alphaproteobacteria bacterium]